MGEAGRRRAAGYQRPERPRPRFAPDCGELWWADGVRGETHVVGAATMVFPDEIEGKVVVVVQDLLTDFGTLSSYGNVYVVTSQTMPELLDLLSFRSILCGREGLWVGVSGELSSELHPFGSNMIRPILGRIWQAHTPVN